MLNEFIGVGVVWYEPEINNKNGFEYGRFSLHIRKRWKDSAGQWKEQNDFVPVSVLGNLCKVLPYIEKGTRVLVKGEFRSNKVEKNGEKKTYYQIQATSVSLLGKIESQSNNNYGGNNSQAWHDGSGFKKQGGEAWVSQNNYNPQHYTTQQPVAHRYDNYAPKSKVEEQPVDLYHAGDPGGEFPADEVPF